MSFFDGNNKFATHLEEYMANADRTIDLFMELMGALFRGIEGTELEVLAGQVRTFEANCDKQRRAMELQLRAGKISPEIRAEMYVLIDRLDKVPNKIEYVANFVSLAAPDIPAEIHGDIKEILMLTLNCVSHLYGAMNNLFVAPDAALAKAQKVEHYETAVDGVERQAIRRIFKSELGVGEKMMLHKFVEMLCSIADLAEDVSDRIKLLAMKKERWSIEEAV